MSGEVRKAFSPGESPEERRPAEQAARERARAYLERNIRQNTRIDRMMQLMERLKDLATRTTGSPFSPRGSGAKDDRSRAVERMIDLDREIDREIDGLCDIRMEINRVLDRIGVLSVQRVLEKKYLDGISVNQIADQEGYTPHRIRELERMGLLEVDRILREGNPAGEGAEGILPGEREAPGPGGGN